MKCDYFHRTVVRFALGLCLAWAIGSGAAAADAPQGLVLHYSFDPASVTNGTIIDKSSLHNDGHVTGAKWVSAGKQGGAMEFTAAKDCITVANHSSLNPKKLTLVVWFKTAKSDAVTQQIIDQHATRGYALSIAGASKKSASRGRLVFTINGHNVCWSDNALTDGAWHQGAAVFDGKEMSLYIDGILQKMSAACPEGITANRDDLAIGLNQANPDEQEKARSFEGTLDEIMIFNRALTGDEIKSLISAVDPSFGKARFTQKQVAGQLRNLKLLYEEGLLTEKFYNKKVAECEAAVADDPAATNTTKKIKATK